jgi:predicted transcriptional regulator
MRHRSRLEIYLDLLNAVSNSSNLADVAIKSRLSLNATIKQLTFLASQGFVLTIIRDDRVIEYELTAKGFETLMAFLRLTSQEQLVLQQ